MIKSPGIQINDVLSLFDITVKEQGYIILSVSNNSKCKNDFWGNSGRFKMFFGTVVKKKVCNSRAKTANFLTQDEHNTNEGIRDASSIK